LSHGPSPWVKKTKSTKKKKTLRQQAMIRAMIRANGPPQVPKPDNCDKE
jgi:hypothetical protein